MRRVFFSFHFARDAWSVGQVRNSWLGNRDHDAQPYLDRAEWEKIERTGDKAVQNWIDSQLKGTSVTAVLIGPRTLSRRWVRYEIDKSIEQGKGLLGVTLEGMMQSDRSIDTWTHYNTYDAFRGYPIYSWIANNGRSNLGAWIETAAKRANR